MSDLDLARRLIAGDEAAFDEFFAEYAPRLYRFARARLGNDDAVEDVVQVTMIRALRKMSTYRGDAPLFTWLCTIGRREMATWCTRSGRAPTVSLVEDQPETRAALDALAAGIGNTPETNLDRADLGRLVQATLDQLPTRYAAALEWRYLHELSVDDIAVRLGVGYKAAESLLSRARQAFRDGFAGVGRTLTPAGRRWPSPSSGRP